MSKEQIRIVVVESGFVFVGKYTIDNHYVYLSSAHNIRTWGTTKGLGEITSKPTKETVLDPIGFVEIPVGKVLFTLPCADEWPL